MLVCLRRFWIKSISLFGIPFALNAWKLPLVLFLLLDYLVNLLANATSSLKKIWKIILESFKTWNSWNHKQALLKPRRKILRASIRYHSFRRRGRIKTTQLLLFSIWVTAKSFPSNMARNLGALLEKPDSPVQVRRVHVAGNKQCLLCSCKRKREDTETPCNNSRGTGGCMPGEGRTYVDIRIVKMKTCI